MMFIYGCRRTAINTVLFSGIPAIQWTLLKQKKLPEYGMAPHTQYLADVAERNEGIFPWRILPLCLMKRLSGQPTAGESHGGSSAALQQTNPAYRH